MWAPKLSWQSPRTSGIEETGNPSQSSISAGRPAGTFLRPSLSSEKAMNSASYPWIRTPWATAWFLMTSARLPMWGIPEAPIPLSVRKRSRLLPSFFSLSISSAAALSYQVPRPMISGLSPLLMLIVLSPESIMGYAKPCKYLVVSRIGMRYRRKKGFGPRIIDL